MNQMMQKLMLFTKKTTRKQCENLTKELLQDKLDCNDDEITEIIELLKNEHVIREKYTFACPYCGSLNTVSIGEIGCECQICSATIDVVSLLDGATIRYILDCEDFYEFMQENYKKEYELAQKGERPSLRLVPFSPVDTKEENEMESKEVESRLFISHSTKDVKYVKAMVEFLEAIGMPDGSIFCSSVDGYKIPWGGEIYDYLAQEFTNENKKLMVLFMLSSNYYSSPACLNEMGAAWVLKKDYRSVLLPGFKYETIDGAIDAKRIGISMDAPSLLMDLNDIKNQFGDIFNFEPPKDQKWDRIRNNFIEAIERAKKETE